jgi:hypothetical protein
VRYYGAFKTTGNLDKKKRLNHDVSDLQVRKSEFWNEARVPYLEFQVG